MSIGRKVIMILEQPTVTQTGTGAQSIAWSQKRELTGVLTNIRAYEQLSQDKQSVRATHRFRIEYPIGLIISEKDRLIKGTEIYDIKTILDPAGQQKQLTLELEKLK